MTTETIEAEDIILTTEECISAVTSTMDDTTPMDVRHELALSLNNIRVRDVVLYDWAVADKTGRETIEANLMLLIAASTPIEAYGLWNAWVTILFLSRRFVDATVYLHMLFDTAEDPESSKLSMADLVSQCLSRGIDPENYQHVLTKLGRDACLGK